MKPIQTNTPNNEDTGEFAAFDSLDAIAAYVHHKLGADALRELFSRFVGEDGGLLKESLLDTAAELEHRGLDQPAAVLYELAEGAISGIDMVPEYVENAGPDWVDLWRNNWVIRRHIQLGTWGQELRHRLARNQRQSKTNNREAPSHKD